MTQLAISFDLHKPEFTTLCRNTDPQTSRDAGRKAEREGTVERHERLIIECLTRFGPLTAKEMERHLHWHKDPSDRLTSVQISRRSGGLMTTYFCSRGSGITRKARCEYTGEVRNGFKVWRAVGAEL